MGVGVLLSVDIDMVALLIWLFGCGFVCWFGVVIGWSGWFYCFRTFMIGFSLLFCVLVYCRLIYFAVR